MLTLVVIFVDSEFPNTSLSEHLYVKGVTNASCPTFRIFWALVFYLDSHTDARPGVINISRGYYIHEKHHPSYRLVNTYWMLGKQNENLVFEKRESRFRKNENLVFEKRESRF